MITEPARADLRQPRRRARLERRLPAPALPAQGHPGARDRSGRERRACGRGARRPDARRVLRRRARRAAGAARAARPTSCSATTCSRRCPDLNDFVGGVAILLAPGGTATFEFPHLARLLEGLQYDTIYHEHFSYFSLTTIREVFAAHGLRVDRRRGAPDPRRLAPRLRRATTRMRREAVAAVAELLAREEAEGLRDPERYRRFAERGRGVEARAARAADRAAPRRQAGRRLRRAGQGQHAAQLLRHPHRLPRLHGRSQPVQARRFTPGTHIPIQPPERIAETRPDAIVILPWNLAPGDRCAARLHGGVGREADRPDPDRDGARASIRSPVDARRLPLARFDECDCEPT